MAAGDPDNPLYPCDSITGRYRATCYRMQTSLMLEYGMSLAEIRLVALVDMLFFFGVLLTFAFAMWRLAIWRCVRD